MANLKRDKSCLKANILKIFLYLCRNNPTIKNMYSLKEAWIKMHGGLPFDDWDGTIYCKETDAVSTFRANETHGYMAAFSFTLILKGWLMIDYNGRELMLNYNDLYIYSPGMQVNILSASDDYHGICLLADEDTTLRIPSARDLVSLAYKPIVQLHEPKVTLSEEFAKRLARKMFEITDVIHSNHIYRQQLLQMLYAVFLLDMQGAQDEFIHKHYIPQRMEELFICFMRILPHHFAEHHDIGFYASQLHITGDYLSRIVRRVSGRTVLDYINQLLVMEASYLLSTTSLSVAQIAERLHFADTPSFSKFFLRLKHQTPREYRKGA